MKATKASEIDKDMIMRPLLVFFNHRMPADIQSKFLEATKSPSSIVTLVHRSEVLSLAETQKLFIDPSTLTEKQKGDKALIGLPREATPKVLVAALDILLKSKVEARKKDKTAFLKAMNDPKGKGKDKKMEEDLKTTASSPSPENFEFIVLLEGFVSNPEETLQFEKSGLPIVYLCSMATKTELFEKPEVTPIELTGEHQNETLEVKCTRSSFYPPREIVEIFKKAISLSGLKSELKQGKHFETEMIVNVSEDILPQTVSFLSSMVETLDKEEIKREKFKKLLLGMKVVNVDVSSRIDSTQRDLIIKDYNKRFELRRPEGSGPQSNDISNILLSLFEAISQFRDKIPIKCSRDAPYIDKRDISPSHNYNDIFESLIDKSKATGVHFSNYQSIITSHLTQEPILVADSVNMLEIETRIRRLHQGVTHTDMFSFQHYESLPTPIALNDMMCQHDFYTGTCFEDSKTTNERVAVFYDCFNENSVATSEWQVIDEIIPNYQSYVDKGTPDSSKLIYSLDLSRVGVIRKLMTKHQISENTNLIKKEWVTHGTTKIAWTIDDLSSRTLFRDNIRADFNINYLTRSLPIDNKYRVLLKVEADTKKKTRGKEAPVEEQLSDVKESIESIQWNIPNHSTLYHYTKDKRTRVFWEIEAYFKSQRDTQINFQDNPMYFTPLWKIFDEQNKLATGTGFTFMNSLNTVKVLPNGCVFVIGTELDVESIGTIVTFNGDLIKLRGDSDKSKPIYQRVQSVAIFHPSGNLSFFENGKWTITKRNGSITEYKERRRPRDLPTIPFLVRSWHPTQKFPKAYSREDGVTIIDNGPSETFLLHQDKSQWIFDPINKKTRIQSVGLPIIEIDKKNEESKVVVLLDDNTCISIMHGEEGFRCMYENGQGNRFVWDNEGEVFQVTREALVTMESRTRMKKRQREIVEFIVREHVKLTEDLRKFDSLTFKKKLNKKDTEKALAARNEIFENYRQVILNEMGTEEKLPTTDVNSLKRKLNEDFEKGTGFKESFKELAQCVFNLYKKEIMVRDHLDDHLVLDSGSSSKNVAFKLEEWLAKIQVDVHPSTIETQLPPRSIVFDGELIYIDLRSYIKGFINHLLSTKVSSLKYILGETLGRLLVSKEDICNFKKSKSGELLSIDPVDIDKELEIECLISGKTDPDVYKASNLQSLQMSKKIDVINFEVKEVRGRRPDQEYRVFVKYRDNFNREYLSRMIKEAETLNLKIKRNTKVVGNLNVSQEESDLQLRTTLRYYHSINGQLDQRSYVEVISGIRGLEERQSSRVGSPVSQVVPMNSESQETGLSSAKVESVKNARAYNQSNKKSRTKLSIFNTRSSLRDMTSSLVDNYFDTLQGRSFAIQNKNISRPFIYSQEDQQVMYHLLQKASEGPLNFKQNESPKVKVTEVVSILKSENSKNEKKEIGPKCSMKDKEGDMGSASVYNPFIFSKVSHEALERQAKAEEHIRKKKTMEFDVYGEPRKKFEVVSSLYKQPLQNVKLRDTKKLHSLESSALTKEFTLSESYNLKLGSAPTDVHYERNDALHRKLIESLDKGFKPSKKPMETDKIIVFPDLLDFGQVAPGKVYKTRFTIINKDSCVMRINVKPPIGTSGISVMKEEGPFAPGLSKGVNVYIDTTNIRKGPFANEIRILTETGVYLLKVIGSVEKSSMQNEDVKSEGTFVRLREHSKRVQPKVEDLTVEDKEMNKSQRDYNLKPSLHVNNQTGRLSISKHVLPKQESKDTKLEH